MPELRAADRQWSVASGSSLLDALNDAGVAVPYSCRAGSCHACLVRCLSGEPLDAMPDALPAARREQGWRLACQCRVVEDVCVEVFDPVRNGVPAHVSGSEWLSPTVLRLQLQPERPLRYRAGQHLVLWTSTGVARPYSLASLPGEDPFLEFHIDCSRPGAFADAARGLKPGDTLRLGELRGGALHYDPDWQERPLWLLGSGTGLGPLWGILREALRQRHQGPIRVMHVASEPYLAARLHSLMAEHSALQVELIEPESLPNVLSSLRVPSRQTIALVCGAPAKVEAFTKRLFIAGLPRGQVLADVFLEKARSVEGPR
ncbi:iron-sulfur-binding ferredoxin reductase [Pseudomonas sp. GD03842]|uniref:iron-sulfur-binding ferredoxin reductase n=1 Tax=Pseudomonas sp. GD03842 TaxID=2975385 RepID=UPI00244852FE|nr:iron-sulfur-binding ferredoxin reductase [Pseudomonas sp. GD03842]MDH0746406.1 iron-sulfur-binding ferredoxin reductase [Pseudomonas sp. GD03842]